MDKRVEDALKRKEEQMKAKRNQHNRLLQQRKSQKQNLDLAMTMLS